MPFGVLATRAYRYEPSDTINGMLASSNIIRVPIRPFVDFAPSQPLQKLVCRQIVDDPAYVDAGAFVQRFNVTQRDLQQLTSLKWAYDRQGASEDAAVQHAACQWLQSHPDTWTPWVRTPSSAKVPFGICPNEDLCSIGCGAAFILQIVLASCLLFISWQNCKDKSLGADYDESISRQLAIVTLTVSAPCRHALPLRLFRPQSPILLLRCVACYVACMRHAAATYVRC